MPGEPVHISEVVDAIEATAPGAKITFDDEPLPFPERATRNRRFEAPVTPLADGVRDTVEHFRARLTPAVVPA